MIRKKIVYYIVLLLPIIDLITAIQVRNGGLLTFGIIFKGLFLLYAVIYTVFLSTCKYRKYSIFLLIIYLTYLIGYFAFKIELLNSQFIFSELTYMIKFLYLPLMFIFLLNYFSDYEFDKDYFERKMGVILLEYVLLLLIPKLLNISYNTYSFGLTGEVGLFFSANEVSIILTLLLPFIYTFFNKKYSFLICLPVIYVISLIGTKVSMITLLFISLLGFLYYLLKYKFKINRHVFGSFMMLFFSILFLFVLKPVTVNNAQYLKENSNEFLFVEDPIILNNKNKTNKSNSKLMSSINNLLHVFLSNRDVYYIQTQELYKNSYTLDYSFFGMGYSDTYIINNSKINKLIEIDFLDLFFHQGLLGLLLELLPIIFVFIYLIRSLLKNKKNILFIFFHSIIISLVLAASSFAGHVLMYPAVSIYLALYLIYILDSNEIFKLIPIKEDKVAILAMHMGVGGIENVLVNQANMLSSDYNVEIISLYNNHKEIPYKLNSSVKVKYLSNFISNREEFNNALRSHNIIEIIKEGFKAIRIIYLKPILLKKYIINSDAKVIISTRKEFSKYLGYFSRPNVATISEEHNHHNCNKREINRVIRMNKNVDYLLPASKELVGFYSKLVKPHLIYIPNTIKNISNKSKCNNKKIVSVGRLSSEKGFDTLLSVMRDVVKKDKSITLDIYGDGSLKNVLMETIKELKLTDNVFLKGTVDHDELLNNLNAYSLYICPSYTESFGLGALEAMNAGLPIIYFDSAKGLNEFCNDSNSICIKNRNVKEMSDVVINIINDKKKLKLMSSNAINSTVNYYEENIQKDFVEFIKKTIDYSDYKKKRVLFVSSQGGHLNELLQLKSLFNKYTYQIMTEKTPTTKNLKYQFPNHVRFVPYGTRFHALPYYLFVLPMNVLLSFIYFIIYRPHVIITTGAHTAGPICCIGKLFGTKVIYIESFANITTKTATGRILYHVADVFVVQWEEMKNLYPNAVYGGWIF